MEIQELDNQIVFIKTRLVEMSADLVPKMQVGSKKSEELALKIRLLTVIKKALRDYRFQFITMTDPQLREMIRMSNELSSIY